MRAIGEAIEQDGYFKDLALLWSQETAPDSGRVELRLENVLFIKSLGHSHISNWTTSN